MTTVPDEYKHIKFGCKPDIKKPEDFKLQHYTVMRDVDSLPKAVSMLDHCGPVRNQGELGCCSGMGSSGALKMLMNLNSYPWPFTPSVLQIYHDARVLEGTEHEDSGAAISDIFQVMNTVGVVPEDSNAKWSWPFSSTDQRWQQAPPPECYADALKHKLVRYMRVDQTEAAIKTALYNKFPLVIGTMVYSSWMKGNAAKKGIIPIPGPSFLDKLLGGHCTFIHSYGLYRPDYVDGQNSWGDDNWGDKGRYHMPLAYLLDSRYTSDIWAVQLLN